MTHDIYKFHKAIVGGLSSNIPRGRIGLYFSLYNSVSSSSVEFVMIFSVDEEVFPTLKVLTNLS